MFLLTDRKIRYCVNFIFAIIVIGIFIYVFDQISLPYFIAENGVVVKHHFVCDVNLKLVSITLPFIYCLYVVLKNEKKNYIKLMGYLMFNYVVYAYFNIFLIVINLSIFGLLFYDHIEMKQIGIYILVFLLALKGVSLFYWFSKVVLDVPNLISYIRLEYQLYHILSLLSPLLVFLFLSSWAVRLILGTLPKQTLPFIQYNFISLNALIVDKIPYILAMFLIISSFIPIYPYARSINLLGESISPDTSLRKAWLETVNEDIHKIFSVSNGSRPLYFIFLLTFQHLFSLSSYEAIVYAPIVLHPLLVLSVYFFTYNGTRNLFVSLMTAFFTMFGFTITMGMLLSFWANILCLSVIFLSLGFLFNYFYSGRGKFLAIALFLGVLPIFIHPWTFFQYLCVLFLMTIVEGIIYMSNNNNKKNFVGLITYVSFMVLIDIIYRFSFGGFGGYLALTTSLSQLKLPLNFWVEIHHALISTYAGLLSNSLFIGLSVYGAWILNRYDVFHRYLLFLLVVTSVFFIFVDPYGKNRFLCNVPFGIYGSLAVADIFSRYVKSNVTKSLILLFIIESMCVYVFRSLYLLVRFLP